jgi:NAD(P)H dehydrogenase (quinone)
MKRILVLLGNPDTNSFSDVIARTYVDKAIQANHDVEYVSIARLSFDPILHNGYKTLQQLEPDLVALQEKIRAADHLVIVYPNWWLTMPALLKGLFDRLWLPGFAFNFDSHTHELTQHLKGKTARVIILSGSESPYMTWWKYGDYTNEIAHGILGFAGIKTKVTAFGPVDLSTESMRRAWIQKVESYAEKGV